MTAMPASAPLQRATRLTLDVVLPLRCPVCDGVVREVGRLCPSCRPQLAFVTEPMCARCGLGFAWDHGPEALCAGCLAWPPAFARARAALRYNDIARCLILGFKHGDRLHRRDAFVRWLERAGAAALAEAEIVCPVPLRPWRLWQRRFNQSALLANALASRAGLIAMPDLLVRRRQSRPSQAGLNRRQRIANLRGAIAVRKHHAAAIAGRHVLLIDDVMTTGATVSACARALERAGAARVDVAVLARAV